MRKKLLTLNELEKTWWWRLPENKDELKRIKNLGYLLSARNYELMRLAPDGGEYTKNYLELDRENKTTVAMAWGNINEVPHKQNYDPSIIEPGWTKPLPALQWNLRLSKRQLKRAFLDYIEQQIKLQNFQNKLSGKKHRPPTWGYVEFLGRRRNKIGNRDDSQRGMASKAEAMALQCLKEFKQAHARGVEMGQEWYFCNYFDDSLETPEFPDDLIG